MFFFFSSSHFQSAAVFWACSDVILGIGSKQKEGTGAAPFSNDDCVPSNRTFKACLDRSTGDFCVALCTFILCHSNIYCQHKGVYCDNVGFFTNFFDCRVVRRAELNWWCHYNSVPEFELRQQIRHRITLQIWMWGGRIQRNSYKQIFNKIVFKFYHQKLDLEYLLNIKSFQNVFFIFLYLFYFYIYTPFYIYF